MKKDGIHPINQNLLVKRFTYIICSVLSSMFWPTLLFMDYSIDSNQIFGLIFIVFLNFICYLFLIYYLFIQKYKYIKEDNGELVMYIYKKGKIIEKYIFNRDSQFEVFNACQRGCYRIKFVDTLCITRFEKVDADFFSRYKIPDDLIKWK